MPEIPDVAIYVERLAALLVGEILLAIRFRSPFVLRTADPPISRAAGRKIHEVRRLGKRIVLGLGEEEFLIIHLMISGRFRWKKPGASINSKMDLCAFDFRHGTLVLTEASTKKRASLHFIIGEGALAAFHRGGLEVQRASQAQFRAALARENHTLKRSLTDPRLFSGIGNAYSDEILHRARLSPLKLTKGLSDPEISRLYLAIREVLEEWTQRLREQTGEGFPEHVTAFRPEMAVHGRYGQPCPVCGSKVQRIIYAENETNYCATCQTGGKLLADRSLSRLLKDDWPKTLEELEES